MSERATCERCAAVQPHDWRAGDLCVACGAAVRAEVRCAWCVRWTPGGAYCRHCGADVVAPALFGAARMLVDGGVDRFAIPAKLAELGAARVEDLSRIHQRHAVVAARHVDELHVVEQHLRARGLAPALDDRLAAELPWPVEVLGRLAAPLPRAGARPLDAVVAIHGSTPFDVTRQAAVLARLRLDDWSAFAPARDVLRAPSVPAMREEAALALTGWRVRAALGRMIDLPDDRLDRDGDLLEALRASTDTAAATVRLVALGAAPVERLEGLDPGRDEETAFDLALLRGDVDRLEVALRDGDAIARIAAGARLVRLGALHRLGPALTDGPAEVTAALVDELHLARVAAPGLERELVQIAAGDDVRTARRAAQVAARAVSAPGALRIARATDDPTVIQALLQGAGVDGDAVVAVAELLVERGTFSAGQFGLVSAAEDGRLPDTFVPRAFGATEVAEVRVALLGVAEAQLGARADDDLHRFVLRVLLGPHEPRVRTAALWALHRWYRATGDARGEGPFALRVDDLARAGWTLEELLPALAGLLLDDATMSEVGVFEWVANLLRTADDAFVEAAWRVPRVTARFVAALDEALRRERWWPATEATAALLGRLATGDPAWAEQALRALRELDRAGNHAVDTAIARLTGSCAAPG